MGKVQVLILTHPFEKTDSISDERQHPTNPKAFKWHIVQATFLPGKAMDWLIYGANGYAGQLIAEQAVKLGLSPVLAGRRAQAVIPLAKSLGLKPRVFNLDSETDILQNLLGVQVVLNCAGPFIRTATPMMEACMKVGAHYFDITGEISVFEEAQRFNVRAQEAGIVICPGIGFDVIPTDCAALLLKQALPNAIELALGFEADTELSPGTAKTVVESLGNGGQVRKNGHIIRVPFAHAVRSIDFGNGLKIAMSIPWGDVSSAFHTTQIPNITVYIASSHMAVWILKAANLAGPLLHSQFLKNSLIRRIEKKVKGPDWTTLQTLRTYIWGEARDTEGKTAVVRFTTPSGYVLTVHGALTIVHSFLQGRKESGTWTPAKLMGANFVSTLPGVTTPLVTIM